MAKKIETNEVKEIRDVLVSGKLIIGTEKTEKDLKRGLLSKVFISSNCPEKVRADFSHYASLANVELIDLSIPNEELGIVCKKPFSVSIVGLMKWFYEN